MLRLLTVAATAGTLALLALLEFAAEAHWLLSLLLFAPPWLFLLPALLLLPLCAWKKRWRLVTTHAAVLAVVLFGYIGIAFQRPAPPDNSTLTVITHNAGQGSRPQFAAFLDREKPDVLLLQDVRNKRKPYLQRFPGYEMEGRGEFLCVSRHLIQGWQVYKEPHWRGRPVVARFEILVRGRPTAFYNVHLPTPRVQLNRFLGGRVLVEMMDDEDGPARSLMTYRQWLQDQTALSHALLELFKKERLPYIVGGDFNTPDHGPAYRRYARLLTDTHPAAGTGFGHTFPGGVRFPVNLFTPFLRIDYLFAGRGWEVLSSAPEPGRLSQHHAVVARFRPIAP